MSSNNTNNANAKYNNNNNNNNPISNTTINNNANTNNTTNNQANTTNRNNIQIHIPSVNQSNTNTNNININTNTNSTSNSLMRNIKINQKQDTSFKKNDIKTAKYNIFTFLPLTILYQFNNYFNLYFLFSTIIFSIPQLITLDPSASITPFIMVIGINIIREGFEDYKKYKYDKLYNNSATLRLEKKVNNCNNEQREMLVQAQAQQQNNNKIKNYNTETQHIVENINNNNKNNLNNNDFYKERKWKDLEIGDIIK